MESNHHDVTITGFWDLRVYQFRHVRTIEGEPRWYEFERGNSRKPREFGIFEHVHASINENLANIRKRIDAAAMRSGRAADEIKLVAVSKTHRLLPLH